MARGRKKAGRSAGKIRSGTEASAGASTDASAGNTGEEISVGRLVEEPAPAPGTDTAQLLAEADALAAGAPDSTSQATQSGDPAAPASIGAAGEPSPVDAGARADEVQPAVRFAVAQLCTFAAPNWNVEPAECNQVADALSLVLAYWMPSGTIEPKYVALGSLAGALWSVAEARRDPETGKFRALRAPAPSPADTQQHRPAALAL